MRILFLISLQNEQGGRCAWSKQRKAHDRYLVDKYMNLHSWNFSGQWPICHSSGYATDSMLGKKRQSEMIDSVLSLSFHAGSLYYFVTMSMIKWRIWSALWIDEQRVAILLTKLDLTFNLEQVG